jgi:hypothetical protein
MGWDGRKLREFEDKVQRRIRRKYLKQRKQQEVKK